MVHIFGQIAEPESRAFWNDEELDASQFQYSLRWVGDNTMPSVIMTLLIVEGSVASDFTKACSIGSTREICVIEHGRLKPSLIYKISNDLYICLTSPDLDARHATEFTMTIRDFLQNAENIITITSQHISTYKSEAGQILPSFLRSLRTKSAKLILHEAERVKQPNIVCGIAAAVMSYAEVLELSAITFVLYVTDFQLDSETTMPLVKLFSNIPGSIVYETVFKQNSFSNRGNLYM